MRIILHGAGGHMGREVCRLANEGYRDSSLAATVDKMGGADMLSSVNDFSGDADVIIDFSHHTAAIEVAKYAKERGIALVMATTGHTDEELAAINDASKSVPVFMSANMSLGIALLAELAKKTAEVFPDADIEIIEKHHNRKLDAPSGTALMIARAIETVRRGCKFVYGRCGQQKREQGEIGIHAIRGGNIVGDHEVIVCTETQIITLKHEAQSRSLFAEGAMAAAAFICGKNAGFYDMNDIAKS
jgi:4-hydroxy-tetrahydrodipicolinate reductase